MIDEERKGRGRGAEWELIAACVVYEGRKKGVVNHAY
jgi:hypothetical protein